MNAAGFSRQRLVRIHDVMAGYVDRGDVPGLVTLVSRGREVHVDAIGTATAGGDTPLGRDAIFRVASMTKPLLAAATLSLVEETRLRLDDPVDPWLPELADPSVLRSIDSPVDDIVPAARSITIRDLLTLRPGTGMIFAPPGTYPIQQALADAGLDPGAEGPQIDPDDWLRRLGSLPLVHQPGEVWMYHTAFDILSVLLARVSGMPLGRFLAERVFEPLGMRDTGFSLSPEQLPRLATQYHADDETGELLPFPESRGGWASPPVFPSEVLSTVDDYLAFSRMLLNYGRYGRERILSRPTVELMTADQITPEQKARSTFFPGFFDSNGWGFGVSVVTRRDGIASTPGRYGWMGGFGTSWSADPREDLTLILMTQRLIDGTVLRLMSDFETLAYQALDD